MSIPRLKSYLSIVATVLVLGQALPAQAVELPDFTQLVEQASPAVVNISTTQKLPDRKVSNQQMPDLEGLPPMLREFFERGMPQPRSPVAVVASAKPNPWAPASSFRLMATSSPTTT